MDLQFANVIVLRRGHVAVHDDADGAAADAGRPDNRPPATAHPCPAECPATPTTVAQTYGGERRAAPNSFR